MYITPSSSSASKRVQFPPLPFPLHNLRQVVRHQFGCCDKAAEQCLSIASVFQTKLATTLRKC